METQNSEKMKTTLDRSALLFLKTLYETKNLVNAANQLGIPPATASRMLGKLREVFNDELFTRCSGGLAATWRTTQAMPDVIRLLADYDQLLEPKLFDPKTLKREFKIAGVDHGVFFLAPAIVKISELAPGVSVDMTELTNDWPVQLRTGELDLLISPMETVPEGFPWLPLWEGRTTGIVVRPGHPLEALYEKTGRVTESDVIRYGFVEVTWRPTTYYRLTQSRLSPLLSERNIVIKTPYFMGAAKIISESNLVMLLSDIMADWFISLGALRRIPVVSEELEHVQSKGFVTKLIWHERSHLDPAMQWMRGMISYAVKETLSGGHVVHPEGGQ